MCSAVSTLEGRDAIQRDVDKPERWAHVDLMKFKMAKCKVLYMGWGKPKHKYRLGLEWIESRPGEKDLGVLNDKKLSMTWQYDLAAQLYPGLHQKKCGQQGKEGDSAPLLRSG